MARSPTRTRKVLLALTLALLAVVLAAWGASYWKAMSFRIQRIWTHADASSVALPQPWVLEVRQVVFRAASGVLGIQWNVDRLTYATQEGTSRYHLGTRCDFSTRPPDQAYSHLPRFYQNQWPDSLDVLGVRIWDEILPISRRSGIAIPCWELALLISAGAAVLGYPLCRSAKRLANNQCSRCGYDRRGLAPAAPCPECNETPAPVPPAA